MKENKEVNLDKEIKEMKLISYIGVFLLAVGVCGLYFEGHGLFAIAFAGGVLTLLSAIVIAYLRIKEIREE